MVEKIEKWRDKENGKIMYRYIPYNAIMLPVEKCDLMEVVYLHNDPQIQREYEMREKLR